MDRAEAAELAGFSIEEARLTDIARERGEITIQNPAPGLGATDKRDEIMEKAEATDVEVELEEFQEPEEDGEDYIVELAADTLRGDVRDSILDWMKATPKPWSQMGEQEQRDLAAAANRYAGQLVREVCKLVAANERPSIVATLVEYKEKDGVEAKLKLPSKGEVVAALHEACGREVLVVTSGAEEFMGQASDAKIDADQPDMLGIGEEYAEAA